MKCASCGAKLIVEMIEGCEMMFCVSCGSERHPGCNGGGPCLGGEIRCLPISGGGTVRLCRQCFARERVYQRGSRPSMLPGDQKGLSKWEDLEVCPWPEGSKRYEGTVEVCCHTVEFWYDLEGLELSDELESALDDEAESRAKTCIVEGSYAGELNCLWHETGHEEIRGWWKISRQ